MRDSLQQSETVRDMQQLNEIRETVRQQTTMVESERHVATLWDRRDSEGQPTTIGDSERQQATMGDSDRHVSTLCDRRDIDRQ